jgi:uracil-DNA glycosylase
MGSLRDHLCDWNDLLGAAWAEELLLLLDSEYLNRLCEFISRCASDEGVRPPSPLIFSALRHTPPSQVRVVVLGQDPYPTKGVANGFAFSSSDGIPQTLRNIFAELNCDVCVPVPGEGDLTPWADQGVLLLNATLTFREGLGVEHDKMWSPFTDGVIKVADKRKPVYILWGQKAQKKAQRLVDEDRRVVIKSPHPSRLSARRGFFGSKPFSRANQALIEATGTGLDWSL